MLSIGCYLHTIDEWKVICTKTGAENNYNPLQIAEYYQYIIMAEIFYNLNYKEIDI